MFDRCASQRNGDLAIGARPSLYKGDRDECRRSSAECLLEKLRDKMAVLQVEYVCRHKRD
jgi:hypothetical protein